MVHKQSQTAGMRNKTFKVDHGHTELFQRSAVKILACARKPRFQVQNWRQNLKEQERKARDSREGKTMKIRKMCLYYIFKKNTLCDLYLKILVI